MAAFVEAEAPRVAWCDQTSAHPSRKAAKDGAPTAWLCQRPASRKAREVGHPRLG